MSALARQITGGAHTHPHARLWPPWMGRCSHLPDDRFPATGSIDSSSPAAPGVRVRTRDGGTQWHIGHPTIGAGLGAASPGATILVCPGTYHEDVAVPPARPVSIEGIGNPVIDATGLDNGVQVHASNSPVEGLTVENAIGEGILVQGVPGAPIAHVTISRKTVVHDDKGNSTGAPLTISSYAESLGSAEAPGDRGEGIHLMVADDSSVVGNRVATHSGGILATDEFGTTDGNLIARTTCPGIRSSVE
jgi:hypothetical protein